MGRVPPSQSWSLLFLLSIATYLSSPKVAAGRPPPIAYCPGPVPFNVARSAPAFAGPIYTSSSGLQTLCTGDVTRRRPNLNCLCGGAGDSGYGSRSGSSSASVDPPPSGGSLSSSVLAGADYLEGSYSYSSASGSDAGSWVGNYASDYESDTNRHSGVTCRSQRIRDAMFFDRRNPLPLRACLSGCYCLRGGISDDEGSSSSGTSLKSIGSSLKKLRLAGGLVLGDSSAGGGRELKAFRDGDEWTWKEVNGKQILVRVHKRPG